MGMVDERNSVRQNRQLGGNRQLAILCGLAIALMAGLIPNIASAMDEADAAKLARDYLSARTSAQRRKTAEKLAKYDGLIEPILKRLSQRSYEPITPGYYPERHFSSVTLREKYPDELLYYDVPKTYRPDQATGLIIFMHGGGKTTSNHGPSGCMRPPDARTTGNSNHLGDLFDSTGMIAVGPSALPNRSSSRRWCLSKSDEYLADVISECKSRFNIDPDRVILIGHSMGGFGAYHHILRQPDRFAAVIANSGSWSMAYWPAIRGTPLCIVQGVHDARRGVRPHYTDVAYGRWTDKLLTAENLDHVYFEHNGKHGIPHGRKKIAQFLDENRDTRRDAYYPHIALASPAGHKSAYCFPARHNRWLTLDESTKGNLEYDELRAHSDGDFDSWRLEHLTTKHPGAMIDAVNEGNNRIVVTTKNVARLTVWLHPRMVDTARPVTIVLDGKTRFEGRLKPSLLTALESYRRKDDWGLIYPMKVELTAK